MILSDNFSTNNRTWLNLRVAAFFIQRRISHCFNTLSQKPNSTPQSNLSNLSLSHLCFLQQLHKKWRGHKTAWNYVELVHRTSIKVCSLKNISFSGYTSKSFGHLFLLLHFWSFLCALYLCSTCAEGKSKIIWNGRETRKLCPSLQPIHKCNVMTDLPGWCNSYSK